MNRWSALALLLAIAGALALRAHDLGNRPLHNDEAVNATKLAALWDKGEYKYDPHEYHGPTLHYFSLPILKLSSALTTDGGASVLASQPQRLVSSLTPPHLSDAQLRVVIVAFGVGLILLLLLLKDGLGHSATAWAALFLAASPAMVFYSRYFIHEMLLVFFTLLTLASGWRYSRSRKLIWAIITGAGVGLMSATKETFVLTVAAMIAALLAERMWNHRQQSIAPQTNKAKPAIRPLHIAAALTAGGVMWMLFFTSFFTNSQGPSDSLATYLPWLNRAGGASPHIHPWNFYFERLLWFHPAKSPVWTELTLFLLAIIGAIAGFVGNRERVTHPGLTRFLTFYTVALTGLYTLISYKTPWCALNFWLGVILLAGIGATALVKSFRNKLTRALLIGLIGVGVLHLAAQSWLLSHKFAADLRNPHVYAQTSPHERELVERVKAIARVAPEGFATTVKVISPESYWPLPWTLRDFKRVGWFEEMPADAFAPIVLVSANLNAALDEKSSRAWIMTGYYELRPNVFLELYVERGLWEKFVATLPRTEE
jgi:uncharacterized protein (TIGR03663 family)